jgi:hypothetical protein
MKISPVNQGDFDRRTLQFLRRGQSPESAAENNDPVFFSHRFSPERNLDQPSIISSIMSCPALMRGTCAAIPAFSVSALVLA